MWQMAPVLNLSGGLGDGQQVAPVLKLSNVSMDTQQMAPLLCLSDVSMERLSSANIERLLKQAVVQVCTNVVPYGRELLIEGAISVTADSQEVCAVSLEERKLLPGPDIKLEDETEADGAKEGATGIDLRCVQNDVSAKSATDSAASVVQNYLQEALKIWYNEDGVSSVRNTDKQTLNPQQHTAWSHKAKPSPAKSQVKRTTLHHSKRDWPSNGCVKVGSSRDTKHRDSSGGDALANNNNTKINISTALSSNDSENTENSLLQADALTDANLKRMFACQICNIEFSFATNLTRHQRKFHGRPCRRKMREFSRSHGDVGMMSASPNTLATSQLIQPDAGIKRPLLFSQQSDPLNMQNQCLSNQPESLVDNKIYDCFDGSRGNIISGQSNVAVDGHRRKRKRSHPKKHPVSSEACDRSAVSVDNTGNDTVESHSQQNDTETEPDVINVCQMKENVVPSISAHQKVNSAIVHNKKTVTDDKADIVGVDLSMKRPASKSKTASCLKKSPPCAGDTHADAADHETTVVNDDSLQCCVHDLSVNKENAEPAKSPEKPTGLESGRERNVADFYDSVTEAMTDCHKQPIEGASATAGANVRTTEWNSLGADESQEFDETSPCHDDADRDRGDAGVTMPRPAREENHDRGDAGVTLPRPVREESDEQSPASLHHETHVSPHHETHVSPHHETSVSPHHETSASPHHETSASPHRRYTSSTAPGKYVCKVCHKVFTFSTNLTRHQRNTHGRPLKRKSKEQAMGERDLFSCELCYKEFMFETYLLRHLKIAHGKLLPEGYDEGLDSAPPGDDPEKSWDMEPGSDSADAPMAGDDTNAGTSQDTGESGQSEVIPEPTENHTSAKPQPTADITQERAAASPTTKPDAGNHGNRSAGMLPKQFPCPVCRRQFSFMSNLIRHLKNLHNIVANRKQARSLIAQGGVSKADRQKLMTQCGQDEGASPEQGSGEVAATENGHIIVKEEPV